MSSHHEFEAAHKVPDDEVATGVSANTDVSTSGGAAMDVDTIAPILEEPAITRSGSKALKAAKAAETLRDVSNLWELSKTDLAAFHVGLLLNMLTEFTLRCVVLLILVNTVWPTSI